jgi:hypothetical protein
VNEFIGILEDDVKKKEFILKLKSLKEEKQKIVKKNLQTIIELTNVKYLYRPHPAMNQLDTLQSKIFIQ